MDETQQTIQVLNEVADISQQLSILQMLFFIIIIIIIAGLVVFAVTMYFAILNTRAENNQHNRLLNTVSELIAEFRTTQQKYWITNTIKQDDMIKTVMLQVRVSRAILRSFRQIIAILEASKLLDTKEMQAIKDENLNI